MTSAEPNFYKDIEVINDPRAYFDCMRSKGSVVREHHFDTVMPATGL